MKWYLNSKNVHLIQNYAEYFPIHSQDKVLVSTDPSFAVIPVNDLKIQRVARESIWQKIVNFFKGAKRYEIDQFDKHHQFEQWELTDLEDKLFRIIRAGIRKKRNKVQKLRSGQMSSDDTELLALMLTEYATYEIVARAKSEQSRLTMYKRLLNMLKAMLLDLGNKGRTGTIMEVMEMAIEKLDEMIQYEKEQGKLRAFQDSINTIKLASVLRKVNEEVVGSLVSKSQQEQIYFQGSRLNVSEYTFEQFIKGAGYRSMGREAKAVFNDKDRYEVIKEGWLKNARRSTHFRQEARPAFLRGMSSQVVSKDAIRKCIQAKVDVELNRDDLEELVNIYDSTFKTMSQMYIVNSMLSLVKNRVAVHGKTAAILHERQIKDWITIAFDAIETLEKDLRSIGRYTRAMIPYVGVHKGRGLFLTSKLTTDLDRIKHQLLDAKQFMHLDIDKNKRAKNQFETTMNVGFYYIKQSGAVSETSRLQTVHNNQAPTTLKSERVRMFSSKDKSTERPMRAVQTASAPALKLT